MSGQNLESDLTFRIHHPMLPVAEMNRSVDFYTRLLGISVMGRRTDPNRMVEVSHVGYGDRETQPSLELTKDTSEKAPSAIDPTGIHVAVHVNDLNKLCDVLKTEHVTFLKPLKASGPDHRRLTAWVSDPDGHAIELVEVRFGV